ncbi:MAG: DNA primase [Candidatus Pacebacteria bacterium]|nr:DNA primase [Candidatus Paceibacterota bacterium]
MSQVQQIKEAIDIVELIGERIELKRGGRNWRGLCPFHGEKSPSFFVSEEMQRYKCFGCGETGDVYNFLEKYEGMTFNEALQSLSEKTGIALKEYKPSLDDDKRRQHLEILNLAKEYYHYLLVEHKAGQKARDYLKDRGTNKDSLKLFQIGYSLPAWDGLVKYLHHKKKYPLVALVETGLVINRKGRHYDRLRDRVMFPLKNHRGQVVGFSGRSLEADVKQAKYINSPETKLYHKAELLYGYNELLQSIRKKGEVIVTEGEFDVISSTQAHVNNIVAIKGSAFTQAHAKYIKRVASKVLFALDMDSAGIEATKRSIPIAQELDLELRVIKLGDMAENVKKDPDDVARENPKGWRDLVKNSVSVYQFLIEVAVNEHDPKTPEGKRAIVKDLAIIIDEISHEVEKDYYLKEIAQLLGVKQGVVAQDIKQIVARKSTKFKKRKTSKSGEEELAPVLTRYQKLEKYAWFLLLRSKSDEVKKRAAELSEIIFENKIRQLLLKKVIEFKPTYSLEAFGKFLPEDFQQLVFDLYLQPKYARNIEELDLDKEWQKTFKDMRRLSIQEQVTQITKELDQLDSKQTKTEDEEKKQSELLEKIVKLRAR